jgi:hypothetical protein
MKSARETHEHLESWIAILQTVLLDKGVSREQASLRMASLLEKMHSASEEFLPPVVALTLTFVLISQVDYIGGGSEKPSKLSEDIHRAVSGLGAGLTALLREEGHQRDEVTRQVESLSNRLLSVANESDVMIFALTIAVTLDKYAEFIIKETLLPGNPRR